MDQTPKDKIIGSDAWKQAIAKYKALLEALLPN